MINVKKIWQKYDLKFVVVIWRIIIYVMYYIVLYCIIDVFTSKCDFKMIDKSISSEI